VVNTAYLFIGIRQKDLINFLQKHLKHFISNLHFLAPPSDPLPQRLLFNF